MAPLHSVWAGNNQLRMEKRVWLSGMGRPAESVLLTNMVCLCNASLLMSVA